MAMVANFVPSPMITWKVKNAANELDDIAKEFSDRILNALLDFFLTLIVFKCNR